MIFLFSEEFYLIHICGNHRNIINLPKNTDFNGVVVQSNLMIEYSSSTVTKLAQSAVTVTVDSSV